MEKVTFKDWQNLQLRVGKVLEIEKLEGSDKLYKMQVDVGFEKPIQIVSSLVPYYTAEEIKDTKLIVLVNLEPAKFRGEVSEGMLLCAEKEEGDEVVLLTVQKDIEAGSPVT
jgi:tRNA-binding protein